MNLIIILFVWNIVLTIALAIYHANACHSIDNLSDRIFDRVRKSEFNFVKSDVKFIQDMLQAIYTALGYRYSAKVEIRKAEKVDKE